MFRNLLMIIARTPFRISFLGCGADYPSRTRLVAMQWLCIVACCLVWMGRYELSAADVPPGFTETVIPGPAGADWSSAVGVTFDATGRMFVWEREGRVWFK